MRTTLAVLCVALACPACARSEKAAPPSTTVLVESDAQDQVRASLPEPGDARLVQSLPRSQTQAWSIPTDALQEFERRFRASGRRYMEPLADTVPWMISNRTVQVSALPPEQRRIVDVFTRGLPADAVRVTEPRPRGGLFEFYQLNADASATIPVMLPDGGVATFSQTSVEPGRSGGMSWYGRTPDGSGDAMLIIDETGVTGTLRLPAGSFSVLPLSEGRQVIFRTDQRRPPRQHPPDSRSGARTRPQARASEPPLKPCDGEQQALDVLLVHTKEASQILPGIGRLAEVALRETQDSFDKSGIPTRVRLAGPIVEVAVPEVPGDFEKTLAGLVASTEVKAMRDRSRADVVVMVVAGATDGGLAERILATPDTAYAIVSLHWMNRPEYNLAHEIGHLFGARHDPAVDSERTPFPHGHGFVDTKQQWRTIMAYDTCACPRIGYWASPLVQYGPQGQARPTGTPVESDDARVIRTTTRRLSHFRCGA